MAPLFAIGDIWRDTRYLLDPETGAYLSKYIIVLAVPASGDAIVVRLTSKPNGLPEAPACHQSAPRAGYYVGVPGGAYLIKSTWAIFDSIDLLDNLAVKTGIQNGRYVQTGVTLPKPVYCGLLRCAADSDDITKRHRNWVFESLAACGC